MKALVYIRITVNNVAAPKVAANVGIIMSCMSLGSTKLGTTPSGGCRAGLSSGDASAAIAMDNMRVARVTRD